MIFVQLLNVVYFNTYNSYTIRTKKGDTVHIKVINNLADNEVLSIHWHGLSQKGTPWADGASGINSCNFGNGKSHMYIFNTADSGTFWYHPHSYNPGICIFICTTTHIFSFVSSRSPYAYFYICFHISFYRIW
jgi:hypothetical protein